MKLRAAVLCALPIIAFSFGLEAQEFPSRTVRIVVAYPPAGASDIVARIVAAQLQEMWKQAVVVENHPGAGGNIGAGLVATAAPDGYTLLMAMQNEVAVNQYLYTKMPHDPFKAFAPVALVASQPSVLSLSPKAPFKTVKELVDYARAHPKELSYASGGIGNFAHLGGALFAKETGVELLHVPFRGTGPGLTAVVGGHVTMMFGSIGPSLPALQDKLLNPLMVMSRQRSAALPDVPSVIEIGYPNLALHIWTGIFAPAQTPPEVLSKLNADINRALRNRSVVAALQLQAFEVAGNSPEEFRTFWHDQARMCGQIIKELGLEGSN
jgi:tripartite-type tricarboxylate transporter receptor subunit TctC